MCSHYEAADPDRIRAAYGVAYDEPVQKEIWPCYMGPMIRMRGEEERDDDQPLLEALPGQFGLLPIWAKDRKLGRSTYNARTETVAQKPSYRSAWKKAQHCVIPAAAIYEPDWSSGKAVPTRITRVDGGMLGIAGLWEYWKSPDGDVVHSYTMLTISADQHSLMKRFHHPDKEKRMVVILPTGVQNDWLNAPASESMDFMLQYPADRLQAETGQV